ncbi:MAG: septum site-determining protein MinC [Anaerolineales bacterium]|nr:septum site-determining protein MinC [Anaerolineales bacterium]
MIDSTQLIQIKGLRDGLLVSMSAAPWEELNAALIEQIESQRSFFQGARVALDVGSQVFHVNELSVLRDTLSERGVMLWAVVSESPTTEQTAQLLGLATRIAKPRPAESTRDAAAEGGRPSAQWIGRTLRSGTRIEFPGHVTVMGDVNPGAEIEADGSVIVWGRVRGTVRAGAGGDELAVICALAIASPQIRIGDVLLQAVERTERPCKIVLQNGALSVETWRAE